MHQQVAYWLVNNRQRVWLHKGTYLRETYGLADPTATFPQPFSYKQYCCHVLDKRFWGDAVILYAISCLWAVKITVLNSQTLQEYRVRHGVAMKYVDIGLVFNSSNHYTAAGKHPNFFHKRLVACCILQYKSVVACASCLACVFVYVLYFRT